VKVQTVKVLNYNKGPGVAKKMQKEAVFEFKACPRQGVDFVLLRVSAYSCSCYLNCILFSRMTGTFDKLEISINLFCPAASVRFLNYCKCKLTNHGKLYSTVDSCNNSPVGSLDKLSQIFAQFLSR
jgi:hypothetical protein